METTIGVWLCHDLLSVQEPRIVIASDKGESVVVIYICESLDGILVFFSVSTCCFLHYRLFMGFIGCRALDSFASTSVGFLFIIHSATSASEKSSNAASFVE